MLLSHIRHGIRVARTNPGASFFIIASLALGIGANTAIFSIADAVLLRPLPYDDPDRLMMIFERRPREGVNTNQVSPADFFDWRREARSFSAMAAYNPGALDLVEGGADPERLGAGEVSASFFEVLGVRPLLGRAIQADDERVGRATVVMLTYGLWQRRFGGDPRIVGRSIVLGGAPYEIVGVLPQTFRFPDAQIEVWLPITMPANVAATRSFHRFAVYGRLAPGVTAGQAQAEMDGIAARLEGQFTENRGHGAYLAPLRDRLVASVRAGVLTLMGAVGFVLLIACVNVANLLLARSAGRTREFAVRTALGAGRSRLVVQLLTEHMLLALAGGVAGVVVALWGVALLEQMLPDSLRAVAASRVTLDLRAFAFMFGVSIAAGLAFGLAPALRASRANSMDVLRSGPSAANLGSRDPLRGALVAAEAALAFALLVGAGLMIRSFSRVFEESPGFTVDRVMAADIALPESRYREPARVAQFFDEVENRLRASPGIESVGAASFLPLSRGDRRVGVEIENRPPTPGEPIRAHMRFVSVGYMPTMGIRTIEGRGFTSSDVSLTPVVVVINQTAARRYWTDQSPIGRRLRLGGTEQWRTVIGVSEDVKHWGLDVAVNPEVYIPSFQTPYMSLVVRSSRDPASLLAAVRREVRALDPDLPVARVQSMQAIVADSLGARRANTLLIGAFALVALGLAAAGVYGVMAHFVTLRTREIGVRISLGASPRDIARLVLLQGLTQVGVGALVGAICAFWLARFVQSLLYHVSPTDATTFVVVGAMLLAVGVLACYVPARRASRVNPVAALRAEG